MTKNLVMVFAVLCFGLLAAEGHWVASGSAKLAPGTNQTGGSCINAVGTGTGKGYGGLALEIPLDLRNAKAADSIRFRVFQNIGYLYVMLSGPQSQAYCPLRLPEDGQEIVLPLEPAAWKIVKGASDSLGEYTRLSFYYSDFKYPDQRLAITDLTIGVAENNVFEYHSEKPEKVIKHQVVNLGRGGFNSAEVCRWLLPKALGENPDFVIVMAGTNDMANAQKMLPMAEYEANMREIVNQLQQKGIKVVLITPPPCVEAYVYDRHDKNKIGGKGALAKVQEAAELIRRIAKEKQCLLVDFWEIVNTHAPLDGKDSYLRNLENSGSKDGVHPVKAGYRALGEALAKVIQTAGHPYAKIVCIGDSITYGASMVGAGTASGDSYPAQLSEILNPGE